jgi:hypothetical protein
MLWKILQGHPIFRGSVIHLFGKHPAKFCVTFSAPHGQKATDQVFALFPRKRRCLGNEFVNVHAQSLGAELRTDKAPLTAADSFPKFMIRLQRHR